MNKSLVTQFLIAAGLVSVAVLWRLVNDSSAMAPNLEIVTAVSLVAAVFLSRYFSAIVPLAALFVSDVVIGNTSIALFTWSAFIVIGIAGVYLRKWKQDDGKLLLGTAGMGLGAAVWFFAWTNFGVWALGEGGLYPKTWEGLMLAYTYGLPFFRATLLSGVVLAPVVMAAAIYTPRVIEATSKRLVLR